MILPRVRSEHLLFFKLAMRWHSAAFLSMKMLSQLQYCFGLTSEATSPPGATGHLASPLFGAEVKLAWF